MAWLKGGIVQGACSLILVRDWDSRTPILLCNEPAHTSEQHRWELRAAAPELEVWLEFDHRQLQHQVHELKRSCGGRLLSEEQYRTLADSPPKGGPGSTSRDGSPRRTGWPAPRAGAASSSSPSASSKPKPGFAERLQRFATGARSMTSCSEPAEPASASTGSPSFAERLARRARESATNGAATPPPPTSS